MIPRMARWLAFGLIAIAVMMMMMIGGKDLRLGSISVVAAFSHMSFGIFLTESTEFPIFVPFISQNIASSGVLTGYFLSLLQSQ